MPYSPTYKGFPGALEVVRETQSLKQTDDKILVKALVTAWNRLFDNKRCQNCQRMVFARKDIILMTALYRELRKPGCVRNIEALAELHPSETQHTVFAPVKAHQREEKD